MKKLLIGTLFATAGFGLPATSVLAEEEEPRWFEIEVIVFKSTSQNGLFNESWKTDYKVIKPENLVDFLQPYSDLEAEKDLVTELGEILVMDKPFPELPAADAEESLLTQSDTEQTNPENPALVSPTENITGLTPLTQDSGNLLLTEDPLNQLLDGSESALLEEEKPFVLLEESLLQLGNEAKTLNRHPEYQVVVHHAWRQPVLSNSQAEHIRIAGGVDYSEEYEYDGTKILLANESEEPTDEDESIPEVMLDEEGNFIDAAEYSESSSNITPPPSSQDNQLAENQFREDNPLTSDETLLDGEALVAGESGEEATKLALPWVPELDGDIKVYLGRYLHIKTNLYLRRPDKEEVDLIELQWADITSPDLSTTDTETDVFQTEDMINQEGILATTDDLTQDSLSQDPTQTAENSSFSNPLVDADNQANQLIIANESSILSTDENLITSQFSWEIDDNFLETESEKMYIERLFNYPLIQSRRVKSGELHFFDHPLMGVLIMIRPYELNQDITEEEGMLPPSM